MKRKRSRFMAMVAVFIVGINILTGCNEKVVGENANVNGAFKAETAVITSGTNELETASVTGMYIDDGNNSTVQTTALTETMETTAIPTTTMVTTTVSRKTATETTTTTTTTTAITTTTTTTATTILITKASQVYSSSNLTYATLPSNIEPVSETSHKWSTTSKTTETKKSTTTVKTTTSYVTTKATATTSTTAYTGTAEFKTLPADLQKVIDSKKKSYPKMKIGFGLFSLDGKCGYTYNIDQLINGACSIKAPYCLYMLETCEQNGINLWKNNITYNDSFYAEGSGSIKKVVDNWYKKHKKGTFNQSYSYGYLHTLNLTVSDNIAYKMLRTKFTIAGYNHFWSTRGGQQLSAGQAFGQASVRQRYSEWMEIWRYMNGNRMYSQKLRDDLHNTQFCSLVLGMKNKHDYYHKSGWNEGTSYNSACDVAIIDNEYMIIIMTQDDTCTSTRNEVVRAMGGAVEAYVKKVGFKNLFW